MKIWIVNPFDPLPGEREQLGRYGDLAQALQTAGHDVTWWSSTFSHRFKRDVDRESVLKAAERAGLTIRLTPTKPYRQNVSISRLRSHRAYGNAFRRAATRGPRPDIILASSPPLESAYHAVMLGRAWHIPTIVDIQDQWPDNFARVMPPMLRVLARRLLRPYYSMERKAYAHATSIIGVARAYVEHGTTVGGRKPREGVFPLGVNLAELDRVAADGEAAHGAKWAKPDGQARLVYTGSLSHNYDFLTIVRAAIGAKARYGDRAQFILTGRGELAGQAEKLIRRHDLDNVTMTGFLDLPEWACMLRQADVGFNAALPDALIHLPNKFFYYLAAGAAVLNTIPGQCAEIVEESGCGLNYTAGDPESCLSAIAHVMESADDRAAMGASARRLAEEVFDRRIVSANLVRFIEQVAGEARSGDEQPPG